MNHQIPMNKAARRKGVTIAAAALSVALVAPFAQSVAYPEISAAAQAQEDNGPVRVGKRLKQQPPVFYANSFGHSNESPVVKARKLTSARAVRTTGVLSLPDTDEYKDIPTFSLKEQNLSRQDLTLNSPSGAGLVLREKTKPRQKSLLVVKEPT